MKKKNGLNLLNINDSLKQELKIVEKDVMQDAENIFRDFGVSTVALDYLSKLTDYPKLSYFATFWVKDSDLRLSIGRYIGLHSISICLMDDIMDGDTPMSNVEKTLGFYFSQYAVSQLCQYNNPVKIVEALKDNYKNIWHAQLKEIHSPPTNMDEWVEIVRMKTGQFMECYVKIACFASNDLESIENGTKIMEATSFLAQFKDDFEDFIKPKEREGNLLNIFHDNSYRKKDVIEFIEYWEKIGLTEMNKGHLVVTDFEKIFLHMSGTCYKYIEMNKNIFI